MIEREVSEALELLVDDYGWPAVFEALGDLVDHHTNIAAELEEAP